MNCIHIAQDAVDHKFNRQWPVWCDWAILISIASTYLRCWLRVFTAPFLSFISVHTATAEFMYASGTHPTISLFHMGGFLLRNVTYFTIFLSLAAIRCYESTEQNVDIQKLSIFGHLGGHNLYGAVPNWQLAEFFCLKNHGGCLLYTWNEWIIHTLFAVVRRFCISPYP